MAEMSDGKIIYEVRVDSSKVGTDLAKARGAVQSGANSLKNDTDGVISQVGTAFSAFLSKQGNALNKLLLMVSDGLSTVGTRAGGSKTIVKTLTDELTKITKLDFSGLNALFSRGESTSSSKESIISPEAVMSAIGAKKLSTGAAYIPYDNFPALLHKGEAVLTAGENAVMRNLAAAAGTMQSAAVNAVNSQNAQNAAALTAQSVPEQNINVTVELDGYELARVMASATNELGRQLNTKVIR